MASKNNADIRLVIGADVDASFHQMQTDLQSVASKFDKNPIKIKLEFDVEQALKEVQKEAEALQNTDVSNTSKSGETNANKKDNKQTAEEIEAINQKVIELNNNLKNVDVSHLAEALQEIDGISGEQARSITDTFSEMGVEVANVTTRVGMAKDGFVGLNKVVVEGKDGMGKMVSDTTLLDEETQKVTGHQTVYKTNIEQAAKAAQKLADENVKNEEAAKAAAKAAEELAKANEESAKSEESATVKQGSGNKTINERISVTNKYYATLTKLETALKNYTSAENSMNSSARTAYNSIKNTTDGLKANYDSYSKGTMSVQQFKDSVNNANTVLNQSKKTINDTGTATKTFGDRVADATKKMSSFFSSAQIFRTAMRAVKDMANASIELNDAMTQLRIVTDETNETYEKFGNTIADTAVNIGASITDLIDSTTTYARLGYSLEESSDLAEYTAMLQNVGNIDTELAQNAITSMIKAFDVNAADIEHVMDELVIVGNNFPISVEQIATGMTNASSTLAAAGNSLEESIALLTAANTTIQDASKSSTGLRTITARIRNTSTELDELGETMTSADYENLVSALTDMNVELTTANGEFRSTYDIMADIADQWDDMTSMEQAALAETLSGTRQQSIFYSIIEQFQEASGAMEMMSDSAGTLSQSYTEYMDSTTAHMNSFKAAYQALGSDLIESDLMKSFIDFGTNAVSSIDDVISSVGGLQSILAIVFGMLSATKNIGIFKTIENEASRVGTSVTNIFATTKNNVQAELNNVTKAFTTDLNNTIETDTAALKRLQDSWGENAANISVGEKNLRVNDYMADASDAARQYALATDAASMSTDDLTKQLTLSQVAITAQNKSYGSAKGIIAEYNTSLTTADHQTQNTKLSQEEYCAAVSSTNTSLGKYITGLNGAQGSLSGYIVKSTAAKVATTGLKVAISALNAVLMTIAISAITKGIEYLTSKISDLIHAQELAVESAQENADAAKEEYEAIKDESDSISELIDRYKELATSSDIDSSTRSEIRDIQEQITDIVGDEASNLDLVNGNLQKELTLLNEIQQSESQAVVDSAIQNLQATIESVHAVEDLANSGGWTLEIKADKDEINEIYDLLSDGGLAGNDEYASVSKSLSGNTLKVGDSELASLQDKIDYLNEMINYLRENYADYASSSVYSALVDQVNEYQDYVDAELSAANNLVLSEIASISYNDSELSGIVVNSADSLEEYRQKMIELVSGSNSLSQAIKEGLISDSDIEELINSYIASFDGFSDYYDEWYDEFIDTQESRMRQIEEVFYSNEKNVIKHEQELQDTVQKNANRSNADIMLGKVSLDTSNLNNQIGSFNSWISQLSAEELDIVYALSLNPDAANWVLDEWISNLEEAKEEADKNLDFVIDLEAETEGVDNLVSAMKESTSATGLTADSVKNLTERYKDLDSFNPSKLFENTANGVHLNEEALKDLEAEYEKTTKSKIDEKMSSLNQQYDDAKDKLSKLVIGTNEYNDTLADVKDIENQIYETSQLKAQYDGLTSSYQKWQKALSGGNERDTYEAIANGYDDMLDILNQGWYGDESLNAYIDLLIYADNITGDTLKDFELIEKQIEGTEHSIKDYLTFDEDGNLVSDGLFKFLDDVQAVMGDAYVQIDEFGRYAFDFDEGRMEEIAKQFGMSTELIQAFERSLIDTGMAVQLGDPIEQISDMNSELEILKSVAEQANQALIESGKTNYEFNFDSNLDEIDDEIDKAKELLEDFLDEDGMLNIDDQEAVDAGNVLTALLYQKYSLTEPAVMYIDTESLTEADEELGTTISLVQQFIEQSQQLEVEVEVGLDTTETEEGLQALAEELNELTDEQLISIGIPESDIEAFREDLATLSTEVDVAVNQAELDAVNKAFNSIDPDTIVMTDNSDDVLGEIRTIDEYIIDDKVFTVTAVDNATGTLVGITQYLDRINGTNVTATVTTKNVSTGGGGGSGYRITENNGTANAQGTAKAGGDWSVGYDGTSLVGEEKPELVVRDGRWFTVGSDSTEFFHHKKNDIIFNGDQTEQIFKYGRITNGRKRGATYDNGTAFWSGSYSSKRTTSSSSYLKKSSSSSSTSTSGSASTLPSYTDTAASDIADMTDEAEEFLEIIDWIEVAIDRIERSISSLDLKASSIYKTWSSRNNNLTKEIDEIANEIDLQTQAYDRYIQEANSVGLSSSYASKVRNGTIDIESIEDEDLYNQIQDYQKWYEKALDCLDVIEELKETQADLISQKFDNLITQYEELIGVIDYNKSMLEEFITQTEESGYITSTKYYDALISQEQTNLKRLREERDALMDSLNEAVASGLIKEQSEEWYNMTSAIDDVTLAIEQANTALIEYNNSIRDIEWEVFDLLLDRISQITTESEFLIDLMSNQNLYTDNGQLTEYGTATMGLYGLNYNTYMEQSMKYAEEIASLDKEIANDPYNQDLINRRQELLELQQESILAAEDEKQAIVSMVEDGIELELSSLKELINTYEDALDAQKDLYDYQKKVAEQTADIAALEKQLSAYQNDTSEENRARIQQIQVSLNEAQSNLEETQYERYISDQKQLLDDLYLEYETTLNMRLDDIDALIVDMIGMINDSSEAIYTTLSDTAESVGYTLSDNMQSIWDTSVTGITNVLTTYGLQISDGLTSVSNGVSNATTTLNATLNSINTGINDMIKALNATATSKTTELTTANSSTASSTKSSAASGTASSSSSSSKSSSSSSSSKSSSSSSSSSWGSWFKYKYDSYPKEKLNTNTSIVDRLKYNNYDSSFSARSSYYSAMGGSGTYTGSSSQNTWMISEMKSHGFKTGGTIGGMINKTGEDGFVLARTGEEILSLDKIKALGEAFSEINPVIEKIHNKASSGVGEHVMPIQNNGVDVDDINLELVLPNVQNYDDFKYAMQHDKNFESMIRSMTVDKLFGGSSLKKYSYK